MKLHIFRDTTQSESVCCFEGQQACFSMDGHNNIRFYSLNDILVRSDMTGLERRFPTHEIREVDQQMWKHYLDQAQTHRIHDSMAKMMRENPSGIKPYREGVCAAESGLSRQDNPYSQDSIEFDFWDIGFSHRTDY